MVVNAAWSAATLFALGGDQILLGSLGRLGPLDAQVVDPRNPVVYMSALDGYQSVEYIRALNIFEGSLLRRLIVT